MSGGSDRGGADAGREQGTRPAAPDERLLSVLVRISRAHWLLGAVTGWLPPRVRHHADEAAELLEGAITDLRRYAARRRGR